MTEKITLSLLTREFAHLLGHMVDLAYSPERPQFTQEMHADVVMLPSHLKTKSLDDISEQLLLPAAGRMAEELKEAHVVRVFDASPSDQSDGVEWSVQRYRDNDSVCSAVIVSVCGAVMRGVEIDGLIVDAFRFTVLYREGTLQ